MYDTVYEYYCRRDGQKQFRKNALKMILEYVDVIRNRIRRPGDILEYAGPVASSTGHAKQTSPRA